MLKSLIDPAMEVLLEGAVFQELHASHTYKHLANQCQRIGLFGAAKFFRSESEEELKHYQKLADYINDRGSVAHLPDVPAIEAKVASLKDALAVAYEKEVSLGKLYENWYSTALTNDITTAQFLLQFVEIQRTSVGEYGDLISRLALAGDNPAAVLMIDTELGEQ